MGPAPEPRATSRRLIFAALGLIVLAIGLVALGAVFSGGGPPIIPPPLTTTSIAATSTSIEDSSSTTIPGDFGVDGVSSFDPFGGGGENDDALARLIDGDIATAWQTERYQDPLPALKPGVGLAFSVRGTPGTLQMSGLTVGTGFTLYWSNFMTADLDRWERIAGANAPPGTTSIDLPQRQGGIWLLWLTDLPQRADGTFYSSVAEVRFLP